MVESPNTINPAYLPWMPSGTQSFSHLHVQCRRAYRDAQEERQNKTQKAKDPGEILSLPRVLWPQLNIRSLSTFANAAVFMMCLPFTTSHSVHYQRHYHFRQRVQSPLNARGTQPTGCNCLPTPAFPDPSPASTTLPQSRLAPPRFPFCFEDATALVATPALRTALGVPRCTLLLPPS